MELFTIIEMNPEQSSLRALCSDIEEELQLLHITENALNIRCEWLEHYGQIRGEASFPLHENTVANKLIMLEKVGERLADHIISSKEPSMLRDLIVKEYKFQSKEELESIEGYCKQFLFGEAESEGDRDMTAEHNVLRRKQMISQQVTDYLREHTVMNLDGFIKFRLQEYVEELREVVEYAVDEFMMDRQYQEFISLLQYFVYIQEAKIPVAHLIHKGDHEFIILDDKLEIIDTNDFDATFKLEVLDKDINFEDMIVSTLITVSPASIYIHTREPEKQVIKTIMQIFEDRTTVCPYCRMCDSYLGDSKQDQLYP